MKNNKNFIEYLKNHCNIMDEKNNEKIIEQQNILLTTILNKAPIGFAVNAIDNGKVLFVSDKFEEIYGVPQGSINKVEDFFDQVYLDPVYREKIKNMVVKDMESGDPTKMSWDNINIVTSSGKEKIIRAMNIPVPEQNLMVSTVQDITENSNLEEKLRESNLNLNTKYSEMEILNHSMLGRELKMIEMKKHIEELEKKLAGQ